MIFFQILALSIEDGGTSVLAEVIHTCVKLYIHEHVSESNEEHVISGCPIDGAISVRVDGGFGRYRWFAYITTLLLLDASWILILHCGPPELPQRHLYCYFCLNPIINF